MINLPRVALVDLDDTLLASSVASQKAFGVILKEISAEIPGLSERLPGALAAANQWFWSEDERRTYARTHQAQARAKIVERALADLGSTEYIDTEAIGRRFVAERLSALDPIPGALKTMAEFRRRGIKLALITNGSAVDQRAKINRHSVDLYFDFVLVEGEVGFGKPDERIFRLALESLEVSPADAWMIGDDLSWDVAGAQAVGIYAIWVRDYAESSDKKYNRLVCPDRIVGTISELLV